MATNILNLDWHGYIGDMTVGEIIVSLAICVVLWTILAFILYYPLINNNMKKNQSLMIRLRIWLGQKYLLNIASGEIHLLTNTKRPCQVDRISRKNRKYLDTVEMHRVRIHGKVNNKHVNGCRWCLGKFDTDLRPLRNG